MMTLRRDDPPEISSTKTIPAETIPAKTTPAGGVPTARVRPLVVTRGILWSFRLLHLAPLVALFLLPVGKWPAVIIAALWPLWLIGLFSLKCSCCTAGLALACHALAAPFCAMPKRVMRMRNTGWASRFNVAMPASAAPKASETRR